MTALEKLHYIENHACIYNIHYCRTGVGFCFYEDELADLNAGSGKDDWRKGLITYAYYGTFAKAVNAEYNRLKNDKSQA